MSITGMIEKMGIEARKAARRLRRVKSDHKDAALRLMLAAVLERAGRSEEALTQYRAVIARQPATPHARAARERIRRLIAGTGKKRKP